jgi:hypothetical protein
LMGMRNAMGARGASILGQGRREPLQVPFADFFLLET